MLEADRESRQHHLELRREQLRLEYEFARVGLARGHYGITLAFLAALGTMVGAVGSAALLPRAVLSGPDLVLLFVAMIVALAIYFAFVFGRVLKLRLELSDVERTIDREARRAIR